MSLVANFIRFPAVKKFWKSVKIWQSYTGFKGGNFFLRHSVYSLLCQFYAMKNQQRSKVVIHTRLRALGSELIPVSWQSAQSWLTHTPGGRLPLLSTRPAVTFPADEMTPLVGTKWYCLEIETPAKRIIILHVKHTRSGLLTSGMWYLMPVKFQKMVHCPCRLYQCSKKCLYSSVSSSNCSYCLLCNLYYVWLSFYRHSLL